MQLGAVTLILFWSSTSWHITHLRQQRHNSKFVIFQQKHLKVLKCY